MQAISNIVRQQRSFYEKGYTKSVFIRIKKLQHLANVIQNKQTEIARALQQDLNKSFAESYVTEIGLVRQEIQMMIRHLRQWAQPEKKCTPLAHLPAQSIVYKEPYGVVCILSPWNYPFQLALMPLIGAVAAGNCCMLKPSEYAPHTANMIQHIIEQVFVPAHVCVVQGEKEQAQELLQERFDFIFFTGSTAVGQLVMQQAAKHMTPVVLELGGKSPCIVDKTANLSLAAKRIIWGKLLNAGQTCVAPDYIFVHECVKEKLIAQMKRYILKFYGENPIENPDYPCIITQKHFERLKGLLQNGVITTGGQINEQTRKIAPTLLEPFGWDSNVMQQEIFGPILPIISYTNLQDAITKIKEKEKPLALYLFTQSKQVEDCVLAQISFGGGCVNDTVIHVANHALPFGGIGKSGMGQYHGKTTFDTFTHRKSVMKQANWLDLPLRYPPFSTVKQKIVQAVLK